VLIYTWPLNCRVGIYACVCLCVLCIRMFGCVYINTHVHVYTLTYECIRAGANSSSNVKYMDLVKETKALKLAMGDKEREIALLNEKLSSLKEAADKKSKVDEKVRQSCCPGPCGAWEAVCWIGDDVVKMGERERERERERDTRERVCVQSSSTSHTCIHMHT